MPLEIDNKLFVSCQKYATPRNIRLLQVTLFDPSVVYKLILDQWDSSGWRKCRSSKYTESNNWLPEQGHD